MTTATFATTRIKTLTTKTKTATTIKIITRKPTTISSYPFSFTAYNVNNYKRAREQNNQANDERAN